METSIRRALADDGTAVVAVTGEIDFTNAGDVSAYLSAALTDWRPTSLRVDLGAAAFIDSAGLGALIAGYREAEATGCDFTLTNVSASFRRILEVTGLCGVFGLDAVRKSDIAS